ncbi:ER membrane protein complex subunit 6 [Schizosaccharomyces cryophilus OY26]|uniref:ER membrane protein complex subunit 6 n=1 Tax=Schizosaccharomyces cryophilus (strain OY26 / ATCC MYA-4695 / CBS 11777 / NBRC 106824 / NRRL Y48691) TaxID=653667 RepID=S9X7Z5_SCHCR|nr:ER membrane protein complex subunit 6 [Schizosaccharomyces cryophilus OY26]EPY49841.1 ER membrane protein complex subunit 6 [Schizosaccharomyces cryophilus OY26]
MQKNIHPLVAENAAHNQRVVSFIRNMTLSVFGCSAGILGLTSYSGVLFYLFSYLFVSFLIYVIKMGSKIGEYYQPASKFWYAKVFEGIPSFVLFWTLFYSLVYVYE